MNTMDWMMLAAVRDAQARGEYTRCPRCGRETMNPDPMANALSRKADVLICGECGAGEALLAFLGQADDLSHWFLFRPDTGPITADTSKRESASSPPRDKPPSQHTPLQALWRKLRRAFIIPASTTTKDEEGHRHEAHFPDTGQSV